MKSRLLITLVFTLFWVNFLHGQTMEELRRKVNAAQQEIKKTNSLLESTRKKKNSSNDQLKLVRRKIDARRSIVSNLDKQIELISNDISDKNVIVTGLENDLTKLKKEYAEMLRTSYKNYLRNNYLTFIFASRDFNDMTTRMYYLRRNTAVRVVKAAQIDSMSGKINTDIEQLNAKKDELSKTMESKNAEIKALQDEDKQYDQLLKTLKKDEQKLSKDLKAKQSELNKLQAAIRKLIEEENKKQNNKKLTTAQSRELIELSGRFDQNMGKLPYPVDGVIVDGFGTHAHPTIKGAIINNTGVNIAAAAGAPVRAVFEGEVSRIVMINNAVLIRHGNYISVYANLSKINVKQGDKVSINQIIGNLPTSENQDPVLHFEIWKQLQNLNPENWLRK